MAQDINGTGNLTNGAYEKPTATDSGSTVFSILESFMERMASHRHDGTDSLLINKKIDKTSYSIGAESGSDDTEGNWYTAAGSGLATAYDNKKVTITVSDPDLMHVDGDGALIDVTREFYYLVDDINGSYGSGLGHQRFYPDIVWLSKSVCEIHTNIWETISAASTSAAVIMKVF